METVTTQDQKNLANFNSEDIYNNKVILTDANLKKTSYSKILYPLMNIFKKDEKDVRFLLEQTVLNQTNICYTGSYEACETVKEKLTKLKLVAEVI